MKLEIDFITNPQTNEEKVFAKGLKIFTRIIAMAIANDRLKNNIDVNNIEDREAWEKTVDSMVVV